MNKQTKRKALYRELRKDYGWSHSDALYLCIFEYPKKEAKKRKKTKKLDNRIDKKMDRAIKKIEYGEEMNATEIAKMIGCSRVYVIQLINSALDKLSRNDLMIDNYIFSPDIEHVNVNNTKNENHLSKIKFFNNGWSSSE